MTLFFKVRHKLYMNVISVSWMFDFGSSKCISASILFFFQLNVGTTHIILHLVVSTYRSLKKVLHSWPYRYMCTDVVLYTVILTGIAVPDVQILYEMLKCTIVLFKSSMLIGIKMSYCTMLWLQIIMYNCCILQCCCYLCCRY